MFKTFNIGLVLGVVAAGALMYFVPAVDQGRERSIILVQTNGGNRESFHVNLPADRIFAGGGDAENSVPPGVDWPQFLNLADSQAELFKVRNDNERVIGVASRIAAGGTQPFIEWAVHMPARGTIYLMLDSDPTAAGNRAGILRAGTREFAELHGSVFERYVSNADDAEKGQAGRLELITALVGPDLPPTEVMEQQQ